MTAAGALEAGIHAYRAGEMCRALDLLLPLARGGDALAQRFAGLAYSDTMTDNPCHSVSEAVHWLQEAADQDDARATYELGRMYKHGDVGLRRDRARAAALLKHAFALSGPAAEAGSAEHRFLLGSMYWDGDGVRKSPRRGLHWLRLAAEQGELEHQAKLGVELWWAPEPYRDMDEAVYWTSRVADQGHTGAQYHLAANFAVGDDVPQDFAKALKWYRRAARNGHEEAAYNLGTMYLDGEGMRPDVPAGLKLLEKGARGGSRDAMYLLAEIRARGLYGEARDTEAAAKWFVTAIVAGDRRAAYALADALSGGRIDTDAMAAALESWAEDA